MTAALPGLFLYVLYMLRFLFHYMILKSSSIGVSRLWDVLGIFTLGIFSKKESLLNIFENEWVRQLLGQER